MSQLGGQKCHLRFKGVYELILIEDEAQKEGKHFYKNQFWKTHGIDVLRYGLPVGDYILVNDKVQDMLDRKQARGIKPKKMDFLGTYDVCVDTKFSIQELESDICGKQHERFRDECILAHNNGIQLYVLVENDFEYLTKDQTIYNRSISKLEDLQTWKNPRAFVRKNGKQLYPSCTKGITLMKACYTMQLKYGVKFLFCKSLESGKMIIDLLGGK